MKKHQLDHVLRAARRITGEKQFVIIGSQSLHGIAKSKVERTEWLNAIGQDSPFHEQFGYYADPVEEGTATLPTGWKARLINLAPGDTGGVRGLCLDPHDLAIAKYVAGREKDRAFNTALARRGMVTRKRLLELLPKTSVSEAVRRRIQSDIASDFHPR